MTILNLAAGIELYLLYGYRRVEWNTSFVCIMANKMERKNKAMRHMTMFKYSLQFRQPRNMVLF